MKRISLIGLSAAAFVAACTPTVQLQAPEKPIEINMNVNIEHHVKVEIERDVQQSISKNKDIF
ncbi:MAG: YnbE family lipoprotein [Micavibrio aeruginosavorus]|nr:YnbE family lipoprotein [Micavibrio aeruginosavorus]